MNNIVLACFAVAIIYVLAKLYENIDMISIDGVRVRKGPRQHEVAQRLLVMKDNIQKLCAALQGSEYKNTVQVERLLGRRNVNLEELLPKYADEAAYSINKGDRIGLCVVHQDRVVDYNTTLFVLLHELAHIMTEKYSHNEEFWESFSILLEVATNVGLYQYQDYSSNPVDFCGHSIKFTPYK